MINLLPTAEKYVIRKEYHLRVVTVCFAMFSFVLVVMVLSYLPTYLAVVSRHETFLAEMQNDKTQGRMSQMKEMEAVIQETNKKIDLLKIGASNPDVPGIFLKILESKTAGLTLTGFSYDFGGYVAQKGKEEAVPISISVQGRSSDRAALIAFKDALVQQKEFKTVDLPISSLVKETDLSFSIRILMALSDKKQAP